MEQMLQVDGFICGEIFFGVGLKPCQDLNYILFVIKAYNETTTPPPLHRCFSSAKCGPLKSLFPKNLHTSVCKKRLPFSNAAKHNDAVQHKMSTISFTFHEAQTVQKSRLIL